MKEGKKNDAVKIYRSFDDDTLSIIRKKSTKQIYKYHGKSDFKAGGESLIIEHVIVRKMHPKYIFLKKKTSQKFHGMIPFHSLIGLG